MLSLGRGLSPLHRANADPSLKSVLSSCVFDLDATKSASYGGSGQAWANLVPTPADGSARSAYDFYLGSSGSVGATDPTFTGTPGSSAAYFALDGGDIFRIPAMTAFFNRLHKTTGGTDWWFACTFRYASNGSSQMIFATRTSSAAIGMSIQSSAADLVQMGMRGDTANATTSSSALPALVNGTDYVLIGSFSAAQANFRWWLNSTTKTATGLTPNASVTDASGTATIAGNGAVGSSSLMGNGTRIYALSMGNAYIDNSEAAKIVAAYNARHGRIYA